MPIYEYECQKCGQRLEKMQGINDKPLVRCPKCKGKLEKQWSQTSFQLKGSGWYVTDYAAKKGDKKSESTSESTSETKSDTDSKETKPAADTGKDPGEKKSAEKAKPAAASKEKKSSAK
ncbi:MAG: zinc ribbon domain-containing protein [Pyrinomonadaceae bacterium]